MKKANKLPLVQALFLVVGAFLPDPAFAQAPLGQDPDPDNWVPVRHLTFGDEEIEGGRFAPDGERIEAVPTAAQPSLIEIREGFEAEIVKSMEDM
jgi:hypothetical protein